jgi:peptidyl-dipeptidase A
VLFAGAAGAWFFQEKGTSVEAKAPAIEAQEFLRFYNDMWVELATVAAENDWIAATDVSDAHTAASVASNESLAAFTGNAAVIRKAKELLALKNHISETDVMQLEKILLTAADNPGTIPEIVKKRLAAEGAQRNKLDGFPFMLDDGKGNKKAVTTNELDEILKKSRDLAERRRAWEASKETGPALKAGLVELRDLRNRVAKEMGYPSFFALQVADYGMTTDEMMSTIARILDDIRPLYEELHCWAKHQLAERYKEKPPARIPAHWIPNRWAQEWPGLVDGVDLDPLFATKKPAELIEAAEAFYVSMGFSKLPKSFWEKSDLYDLPAGSPRKKNTHASAWHINYRDDVRSLMSVKPNFEWFETTHHELGHIYYYISYSNPQVPYVLRQGANRGYHEGIGELISLAASQQPYLRDVGVLKSGEPIDEIRWLLNDALRSVIFLPFAAGVMTHFERDLYEKNLSADEFNKTWWNYVAKFQGVEPPSPRGEQFCDAATKTHINDDPAQYYDYALATVLKFQLHDHICKKILKTGVHNANYRGNKEVGDFLRSILTPGASKDWRVVLKEATGEDLNGRAMLEYYAPLLEWLKKQNEGKEKKF